MCVASSVRHFQALFKRHKFRDYSPPSLLRDLLIGTLRGSSELELCPIRVIIFLRVFMQRAIFHVFASNVAKIILIQFLAISKLYSQHRDASENLSLERATAALCLPVWS